MESASANKVAVMTDCGRQLLKNCRPESVAMPALSPPQVLGGSVKRARQLCQWFCLALLANVSGTFASANSSPPVIDDLVFSYIQSWKDFYPSQAFAYGDVESAAAFEDFSEERVGNWLALNAAVMGALDVALSGPTESVNALLQTDALVLRAQVEDELGNWEEDAPLTNQPQWYAEQVSQALTHLLVRDQLSAQSRSEALISRLAGVERLCRLGTLSLQSGNAMRTRRALNVLESSQQFYDDGLRELVADWPAVPAGPGFDDAIDAALAAIADLQSHLQDDVLPVTKIPTSIGIAAYTAKLQRRTSGLYTPESLVAAAGEELRSVRGLMYYEASRWAQAQIDRATQYRLLELTDDERLEASLAAMERDRQSNSSDFLASFTRLTFAAESFVAANRIATIPKPTTLLIALSPAHFSGAAVGGVYPSGPFDTQADTLFYIPSIADDAPQLAKDGFYRSFNTHFNTMILSHEMFPGHYLQYKVAVSEAPMLRSLFSNGSYVEGWGSFVEELMLDAGWADNAPLTRLAHLRKRLENATRAYVSVQVNTAGWGEEQVLRFARDEGLLAPQFATNLWQRVVNSPLQLTDYFTGFWAFKRLYGEYLATADEEPTRVWVDAVLRAGPLPMTLLGPEINRLIAP